MDQVDTRETPFQPNREAAKSTTAACSSQDESGVDRSLISWMLSMTPLERLRTLQSAVDSLNRLRRGSNPGL
jgi:hypothetical protein